MLFPILLTERLKLRRLEETDIEEIFLLRSDAYINKYLARQPSKTSKDALVFIKKIIENDNLYYWAITQKNNGKLIGTICLFNFDNETKKCEIGYELLTEYQGQGFMLEAMKKVINYSSQVLQSKIIEAFTHKDNQASTRILKRFSFLKAEIVSETEPNIILYKLVKASPNS